MFIVKSTLIGGLIFICICKIALGEDGAGSRRTYRSTDNDSVPREHELKRMLAVLNGATSSTKSTITTLKNVASNNLNNIVHTVDTTKQKNICSERTLHSNNTTSNVTASDIPENYTLHGNSTFTSTDKKCLEKLRNKGKSPKVRKSDISEYNGGASNSLAPKVPTILESHTLHGNSRYSPEDADVTRKTYTRSLLNAFLINAMNEKVAVAPANSLKDRHIANLTVSNAGTRSDMGSGLDVSSKNTSLNTGNKTDNVISENATTASNKTGSHSPLNTTKYANPTNTSSAQNATGLVASNTTYFINTTISLIPSNKTFENSTLSGNMSDTDIKKLTNASSLNQNVTSTATITPSAAALRAITYSNSSSSINNGNETVTVTKSYMNATYDVDDTNLNNSDSGVENIVQLIRNLTESNWTAYPLSMTSSGETISSLAKLISSLNALNWTEHTNTSSDASRLTTAPKLMSAANTNDSFLEHSKNIFNLNDTLLLRLNEYLKAMNLSSGSNTSAPSNTSLRERLEIYLDKLNASNRANKTVANFSETLLERAKKFPTISNLLEKGKSMLEKNLGVTIEEKQVAELVSHFINWRDQSGAHPCLKDILNAREVNECFARLAASCDDTDGNSVNSTRRNVLTNLRHFLTCKKRHKNNSGVLVGNFTLRKEKTDKKNETSGDSSKQKGENTLGNDKLLSKEKSESRETTDSKMKNLEKWMFGDDDCDDSIYALEKCQLEKSQLTATNKTLLDLCEDAAKAVETCQQTVARTNKTEVCDPNARSQSEACKFKTGLHKFVDDTCGGYRESYKKCNPHKLRRSTDTNNTCNDALESFRNCKKNAKFIYQQDCAGAMNQSSRCFIMNHLSQSTFSGNIEKADVVKGLKTIDGARNETLLNVTTDIQAGNDSFTLKNLTTFKECDGCLKNNNTGPGNNFLSFNAGNTTNEKKGFEDFLKKFEINKMKAKCHDQAIFEMWRSQDDDDKATVRSECSGLIKRRLIARIDNKYNKKTPRISTSRHVVTKQTSKQTSSQESAVRQQILRKLINSKETTSNASIRNLVSEHTTTHNKHTESDGTVTKDKTSEGTKLKDDEGREVTRKEAGGAEKVSFTEQKQPDEEHPHDEKYAENRKILDDILSGKHEKDNDAAATNAVEKPIETDENRTIPIDPSIIKQGEQTAHDPENPDADMGIVGIDSHPAIEIEKVENKTNNRNNSKNDSKNVDDDEIDVDNDDEKKVMKTKAKEDRTYWLGKEPDENVSGKKKEDVKRILCFGDSITKGYYDGGRKNHPYSIKLEALLREDNIKVEIINHGVNGQCVSLEMQRRLAKDLEELPKLDLVIILGGTNDLLSLDCVRKLDLFQEIKNLHILVKAKEYKSVVVTIPEAKLGKEGTDKMTLIEYRRELDDTNQKLRMYAFAAKLPLIDLADDFSRHSLPGKTNVSAMWDDDVHPSRQGYDRIGEIIYDQIKELL